MRQADLPVRDGLLLIGDPHIEGRQPGFRCDDYPNTILEKLRWLFEYSRKHNLLPILLGDLFEKPRDNPTWIVGALIDLMEGQGIIGIYGNHDCAGTALDEHDTLSLLIKSNRLRLVSADAPWRGIINGRAVVVGGSSYRHPIPESFVFDDDHLAAAEGKPTLGVWLTHHDLVIPGYDAGRQRPREIANIDLVVNGHIHRRLDDVVHGRTRWITPGNISRRSRSEASMQRTPTAVRLDVPDEGYTLSDVIVPHRPAEEVFHETVAELETTTGTSRFVAGLGELLRRRTDSGAGLQQFLEQNLPQFPEPVADEIQALANEVLDVGASDT